jgi:DNA-binding NarL/FixJ family response regulator
VSEETVRSHAKNILEKMKQPNRAQAVLSGMRLGWIELNKRE